MRVCSLVLNLYKCTEMLTHNTFLWQANLPTVARVWVCMNEACAEDLLCKRADQFVSRLQGTHGVCCVIILW